MAYENKNELFERIYHIERPWRVSDVTLSADTSRIDIAIVSAGDGMLPCPKCGRMCKVHDRVRRSWRDLDIGDSKCYFTGDVPRTECGGCGVLHVQVPWARPYVSYTKRLERKALGLLRMTSITAVSRELGISYDVLFGIVRNWVREHLDSMDLSNVRRIHIDETSAKRGHRYVTVIVDADTKRIVFISEGKGADTVSKFSDWMISHGGDPKNIRIVSCDFSKTFLQGIRGSLPRADIVYDRFHLVKMVNDALDKIRASNQVNGKRVKSLRFALLRNGKDLRDKDHRAIMDIRKDNEIIGSAYEMKESLIQVYDCPDRMTACDHLERWTSWVFGSGHDRMKAVARTVSRHADHILNWFDHRISNGFLEGLNGMIQTTKRIDRGFPNTRNFMDMILFKHGHLDV